MAFASDLHSQRFAQGLAALVLLAAVGCSGGTESSVQPAPSPVASAPVSAPVAGATEPVPGAPPDAYVFTGDVEASLFTELRFGVAGRVEVVRVRPGDRIREGAVLASLDTIDRTEALRETRRRLKDGRSVAVGGRTHRPGNKPPAYIRQEMEARQLELKEEERRARAQKRRMTEAMKHEGQEGATRVVTSGTHRRGRRDRASRADIGGRTSDDRLAVALLDDLDQRRLRLEREIRESDLTSPLTGVVVMVGVREGQQVQTRGGDAAFVLLDPSDFVVRIGVPTELASVLQEDEGAWLDLGGASAAVSGTVVLIDSTVYESVRPGEGNIQDILIRPDPAVLDGLEVGQPVRVALRR